MSVEQPSSNARHNNFDALRLIAALLVVVSHAYVLSNCGLRDVSETFTRGQCSFGGVGVMIFFVASGYLITQSYLRLNDGWRFLAFRGLRIFPGLWAALVVSVFALGPLFTRLSVAAYFGMKATYAHLLMILLLPEGLNIHLFGAAEPFNHLPGVFQGNFNGSLWTLAYEFACYLLVAMLGWFRAVRPRPVLALFVVTYAGSFLPFHQGGTSLELISAFAFGMVMFLYRERLQPGLPLLLVTTLAFVACIPLGLSRQAALVPLGLWSLRFAFSQRLNFRRAARFGDFSYGLYIYAFPIQLAVTSMAGGRMTWWANAAIAAPITLVLAFLSWHLVEKRALALKRHLRPARENNPAPAVAA